VIKGVLENYRIRFRLNGMKAQAQALAKSLGISLPNTATMNAARLPGVHEVGAAQTCSPT